MREFFLFLIYALISVALQSTVLRIDLLFIAVVFAGMEFGLRKGLGIALMMGIFAEVFSSVPSWTSAISYIIVYLSIRMAAANIFFSSPLGRFSWVVVFSLLCQFVQGLLIAFVGGQTAYFSILKWSTLPQALFNGLLSLPLFPFLRWYSDLSWQKIFRPRGLVLK